MNNWQPIETAPKDGSIIILRRGNAIEPGYWDKTDAVWPWHFWCYWNSGVLANAYREGMDGPSHWMPLPEPPTEANA